jgi:autotransporter-associated beta strand protein
VVCGTGRLVDRNTSADCRAWPRLPSSLLFAAALTFIACLPNLASACQISLTGTQSGVSNSVPVDCISVANANITGDVNNTGSILLNGISVTNSVINGAISNVGSRTGGNIVTFVGGIHTDSNSSITSGSGVGIGIIGVPNFAGGIASGASIVANNGIYVDSVSTFTGGISNTGRITAGNGFSISDISAFSGGVSNSGQLIATNYGISVLSVTNFAGGIFNTGDIKSTGVNAAGISLYNGSFSGGITNSGRIDAVGAGITLGDIVCVCIQPPLGFSGGIWNSGTIAGGFAGIVVDDPTKFAGGIMNTGVVSGVTGLVLFYNGAEGINVFNSGTITGTGGTAITFGGLATLTLAPTSVINGKVTGGSGNNILQLGGSGSGTFDVSAIGSQYLGFGTFNKIDDSTWTLTGAGTFAGAVNVNSGTLLVNGSLASASVTTVNSGGTLGGTGIVGNTIINGGTLSPGNSMGALTVQGSLAFTAAASYMIEVSSFNTGSTDVTGIATLGGTVRVISPTNSFRFNSPYTILISAGLGGTQFNALTTPTGVSGSLIYSGNNVQLNLMSALGEIAGLNANQHAVASTLDAAFNAPGGQTGGLGGIFAGNVAQNLAQATGETVTGSQQTTFNAMTQFLGLLLDPFIDGRSGNPATSAMPFAEEGDANAYASSNSKRTGAEREAYAAIYRKASIRDSYDPRWSVWAAGFGGSQTTDGNATLGSNNTMSRVFGMAAGADYIFSPRTIAGFALSGGGTNFSVANGGSGSSDLFQAGAFIRHTVGAAYFSGALAYGWQDVTTDRTVTIAGVDRLRAQFNTNAFSGRAEGGYRFITPWIGVGITPYAAAQFTTFELPAYAEQVVSGANTFALAYAAKSVTATRSELGVRFDRSYTMQNAILILRGRAAWAHDYDGDRNVGATFQTLPGATFVVNGAAQASDSALATASVEVKWRNGWSAAATFDGEFSNVTRSYAGKGLARYTW